MRIAKKIIAASLTLSSLGVAPLLADSRSNDTSRNYDRVERVEHVERHDEWRGHRADWVRLGTVTVGRQQERDLLEVPGRERFKAIMFRVEEGNLVLDDLKITFSDDSSYSPETNIVFREGQRSGIIDMPGYSKDIKRIRFLHRALNRSGAVVEVYGLK